MIISLNWLKKYFAEDLPKAEDIARALTMHSFEVESFEEKDGDTVFDVKVLPNRAHDCLSHYGIAREVGVILNKKLKPDIIKNGSFKITKKISVNIEDSRKSSRYIGALVDKVTVGPSPEWLKKSLEVIGQKSINNIVDATNYVMFSLGQPLHAFDADKVKGTIRVRLAKEGEKIELLGADSVGPLVLNSKILVIADNAGPLAIAGIKGGKRAEVTEKTKKIILESANFDPVLIRKTSKELALRTEASARFENEISPELASFAMHDLLTLVLENGGDDAVSLGVAEEYPKKQLAQKIIFSIEEANKLLGVNIDKKKALEILKRLGFEVSEKNKEITLVSPMFRLDIAEINDIAEEIGRIYGYENIKSEPLEKINETKPVLKIYFYKEKIREALSKMGFSEVYNYSLVSEGKVEIANPLASDKNFLRTNLSDQIKNNLEFNLKNAELLGLSQIKIFELGNVFPENLSKNPNGGEHLSFCLGIKNVKGYKGLDEKTELAKALEEVKKVCESADFPKIIFRKNEAVAEINFERFAETLKEPKGFPEKPIAPRVVYKKLSAYPFMLRDIAVFVPETVKESDILKVIEEKSGKLLCKARLFDVFRKKDVSGEEKISYAFHLVFQSNEKTLSDAEVNEIMKVIEGGMNSEVGWRVR